MLITGELKKTTPLIGYGNNGKRKGGFIIQINDADRAKQIFFTVFEKTYASLAQLRVGDEITVDFTIESREWNEKYYTDAIAWTVIPVTINKGQVAAASEAKKEEFRVPDKKEYKDDLPF